MAYLVKNVPNTALVSLVAMTPQPRSRGVQFARTTYAASGKAYQEGPWIALEWDFIDDATAYSTLLTQFGLSASVVSNSVTVYVPNNAYAYTRYNGTAVLPQASQDNYFIRGVVIVVKDLAAL